MTDDERTRMRARARELAAAAPPIPAGAAALITRTLRRPSLPPNVIGPISHV